MTSQSKEKDASFTQNSLEIVSFLHKKSQRYLSGPMHPAFAPDSRIRRLTALLQTPVCLRWP